MGVLLKIRLLTLTQIILDGVLFMYALSNTNKAGFFCLNHFFLLLWASMDMMSDVNGLKEKVVFFCCHLTLKITKTLREAFKKKG